MIPMSEVRLRLIHLSKITELVSDKVLARTPDSYSYALLARTTGTIYQSTYGPLC